MSKGCVPLVCPIAQLRFLTPLVIELLKVHMATSTDAHHHVNKIAKSAARVKLILAELHL